MANGSEQMKKSEKVRTVLDDEIPLRGILKSHCGNLLSGDPGNGFITINADSQNTII